MAKKQTAGRDILGEFAPKFAELNDDVLFGDIWAREEKLSPRDRSMITVSALIAGEIAEIITHLSFYAGWPKAWSAFHIAKGIFKNEKKAGQHMTSDQLSNSTIFPIGEKIEANFTGDAYLQMIFTDETPLNASIGNVTFASGARNYWHSHKIGQVLLVTGGEGWYQEEGKPAQLLKTGDVINIPPHVKHWHGATKDSWFVHLAITPGETDWLEPVHDDLYYTL
ncbi:Carboxymuconolactone decarboxylase [Bacillus spizizenii str. W23]|uniref:Carboxymuconolactone decarboxylase n=2 Tax=Bacillus spizizenii TaxID=96241 RepID=E0TTX2_BACSH|nr:Carboxymuconolactone decarboxylase [Bacillus spizizenii str. W23]EFG90307.1 Carboxymuconolactone decarboxylase [Bacillus spizizenii ATCC 6633 = JCM 2499]KFK78018.1 carboxymuconolactone decarboxylase family protein [Bacillus spizizenii]QCJ17774.1 cupin domain-containing protein [Bacillus subtilis]MBE0172893.1 cupin domain-containing protein [Bacillus spizizenii]